jgi:hypothetical protein
MPGRGAAFQAASLLARPPARPGATSAARSASRPTEPAGPEDLENGSTTGGTRDRARPHDARSHQSLSGRAGARAPRGRAVGGCRRCPRDPRRARRAHRPLRAREAGGLARSALLHEPRERQGPAPRARPPGLDRAALRHDQRAATLRGSGGASRRRRQRRLLRRPPTDQPARSVGLVAEPPARSARGARGAPPRAGEALRGRTRLAASALGRLRARGRPCRALGRGRVPPPRSPALRARWRRLAAHEAQPVTSGSVRLHRGPLPTTLPPP